MITNFRTRLSVFPPAPPLLPPPFPALAWLTDLGHLRYGGLVGPIQEAWLVVIDVLDLDDELGLGLQGPVRQPVASLGAEHVLGLDLTVQALDGVDVPCAVVDGERGARPFACQDVLDGAIAQVHVRVEL